jgi:CHAT domain-containing protein
MPDTPGHPPLPATAREANEFVGAFAGTDLLVGASATREAVRAALPGAATVHFACHASSDPVNAEMSHLLLHDGPLSVVELSRLSLVGAELAYLSACATARGSAVLVDEAVHLASAFQLAGYPQAIGTLWEARFPCRPTTPRTVLSRRAPPTVRGVDAGCAASEPPGVTEVAPAPRWPGS